MGFVLFYNCKCIQLSSCEWFINGLFMETNEGSNNCGYEVFTPQLFHRLHHFLRFVFLVIFSLHDFSDAFSRCQL